MLAARDLKHIWHPCAQMQDYEIFPALEVMGASGCHIQLQDGRKVIDATASWWCKSLGHQHPRLQAALIAQLQQFEHVMFAHTTYEVIVALSEKLTQLLPVLNKVLYASDGSSAVEMAMKLSLHARERQGERGRNTFVALENAYHGETVGALSVSDLGIYRNPYRSLLFPVQFITPLPYVKSTADALWDNCADHWAMIEKQLNPQAKNITAIIVEPVLQGAAGMKIYSQDFLKRLRLWTEAHGIHLIADEIMTGIGRTGRMLACQHANIEPDFICLGKGLTSGCLPLSAVLTRQAIYDLFYGDKGAETAFLHSHTHAGNALAASVALEVLKIMETENICGKVALLAPLMRAHMQAIADSTAALDNVRSIGAMVAADLIEVAGEKRRLGFEFYRQAAARGALMRPLGNTIYWVPPLNIDVATLNTLKEITLLTLEAMQHGTC